MKNARILSALLSCALAAGMCAGCAGNTGSAPDASSAGSAASKTDSGKKTEIEYFGIKAEVGEIMEQLCQKFNESSGSVTVKQTVAADAKTVLFSRVASNDVPDVFNSMPTETNFKEMFRDGQVVDLMGQEFLNNVNESTLKMTEMDGKQYCLPVTLSAYGLYYRTDIFEEKGLKAPSTWEELIDAAGKIQASGMDAFAFPNKDIGFLAQRMERMIGIINNDSNAEFERIAKGEIPAQDSEMLKTFIDAFYELNAYCSVESLGMDQQAACADFANGKAAMMINGTWTLSTLKASNPDIQCELIPLPNPAGGEANVPVNVDTAFSISSSSKSQEAALAFLSFLAQPDTQQLYCDFEGSPNQVKGVEYNFAQHKAMADVIASGKDFITPAAFWPSGFKEDLRTYAQQLLIDGDKDAFMEVCAQMIDQYYNAQ